MTSKGKTPRNVTIHDMDISDRPREKLRLKGPTALSDPELVAILLRTGTKEMNVLDLAARLLKKFKGVPGLQRTLYEDLLEIKGISDAKACQLKAAIELGRRSVISRGQEEEMPFATSPEILAKILNYMEELDHEEFHVVLLDNKKRMVEKYELFRGTVNSANIRPAEVFKHAVRRNLPAIAIAHNHPSGNPDPSPSDKALTKHLLRVAKDLDIELVDHMVIGKNDRWISMNQEGMGGF